MKFKNNSITNQQRFKCKVNNNSTRAKKKVLSKTFSMLLHLDIVKERLGFPLFLQES